MPLTQTQRRLLDYLVVYIREHRVSPSYEEIAARFRYRSLATVHEHLRHLAAKGLIRMDYRRSRSLQVLRTDDRPREHAPLFPPREWLGERCDERPLCPLPREDALPLALVRRYRERWRELQRLRGAVDELWTFRSPEEAWRQGAGRAGYALLRDGEVVDGILVLDQLSEPGLYQDSGFSTRDSGGTATSTSTVTPL